MANFTWSSNGGSGDWSSVTNWTTAGAYPGQSGPDADSAFLKTPGAGHSYTVTYDPTTLSYSDVTLTGLTLAGTGTNKTTTLQLVNGTMTVDGTINVGSQVNSQGSAILGSGSLDAGGGNLVALTSNASNTLTNTTSAATATGIGSSVVLGDDNTAGTVMQLDANNSSTLNNAFDFTGTNGGALALSELTGSSLNYTGIITGMNVATGTDSVLTGVNYLNVQTPDAAISSVTWTTGGDTITLHSTGGPIAALTLDAPITSGQFVDWIADGSATGQQGGQVGLGGTDVFLSNTVCYAAGTRIATADGETAVEHLAEGDLVVTLTGADRTLAPVTWIGYRRVDLAAHPRRELVAPVQGKSEK